MQRDRQNRRRPTRNLAVVVGVVLLIATAMSVASAATTTERWTAKLGSIGQYGSVTLTRTVNNGYSRYDISASVKHFRAKTTYTVTNATGTCSVPGGPVTSPLIQNLRTNAAGSASVSYFMSYDKGNVLIEAMNAGNVIVRVGTRCGYLRGPAAVVLPSPTPTQRTQFSPGPGVPVLAGRDEMVVTAAERWSDPSVPVEPGMTLDTVNVDCRSSRPEPCLPASFVLRDSEGTDHAAVDPGRPGWLTFAVPTALSADVTLVWTANGYDFPIPLQLPEPPEPVAAMSLVTTTGLEGAVILDAVGAPTRYVSVGFADGPNDTTHAAAWTSPDGETWTKRTVPHAAGSSPYSNGWVKAVARGSSGLLVAVGAAPLVTTGYPRAAIWTSGDDGVTWTRVTGLSSDTIPEGEWHDVTASGSGFVVVGNLPAKDVHGDTNGHAAAMVSTDGTHWTRSSPVGGANWTFMGGVVAGGPGLIAWGGTANSIDAITLEAKVWTSTDGKAWTLAPEARDWHNPDGGGATSRKMELIFGSAGDWTGIVSHGYDEMRPLVYGSTNATTWTPVDVAASLREFYPTAAEPIGSDWLLGGRSLNNQSAPSLPTAWLGHGGTWAPITVPRPDAPDSLSEDVGIQAFADGPSGLLAIGTGTYYQAQTHSSTGVVWSVPTP